MATFTRKKLALLKLTSDAGTDIYDSGTAIGLVHNIVLFNSNGTSETIIINMYNGSTTYQLFEIVLTTKDSVILDFKGEGLVVDANSKLTGSTTTGNFVTCLVTGSEETA